MNQTMTNDQLAQAMLDPSSMFPSPVAIVGDKRLASDQKIELLRRWEYDAREMQVAEEEGFPAREPGSLLDTIIIALHRLGAGPDIEHSPPTKQGGV